MFKNSETYMPTYTLIAINVAVYGYTSILSGNINGTSDWVISSYGQNNALVLNGEAWRLLTAIFIHANLLHIVGNMLFLLIFGLRAEKLFDLKEYLAVYFLSGLAGGLLTLLMGPDVWSIGDFRRHLRHYWGVHDLLQPRHRPIYSYRVAVFFLPVNNK